MNKEIPRHPVTVILCDTREPEPHPWGRWLPSNIRLKRETLETGDFALAGLPDGAVIERKTVSDFLGCITQRRDRFERELKRSRHLGAFCVVVEGSLTACLDQRNGIHPAAFMGTVAAWSRRFCPIVFAGNEHCAASFAWRFLVGQIKDAEKILKGVEAGLGRLSACKIA